MLPTDFHHLNPDYENFGIEAA